MFYSFRKRGKLVKTYIESNIQKANYTDKNSYKIEIL